LSPGGITLNDSCNVLETALRGEIRSKILDHLCKAKTFAEALTRLRAGMRAHTFNTRSGQLNLGNIVRVLDQRTKQDGFNVLIDWDGKANKWNEETIPVDVLNYYLRGVDATCIGPRERQVMSILLDYYFLYVVALCAMHVWDEGSVPANVDRVTNLIAGLQGPAGSGHKNVDDTGTLILVATAHFEPDADAYERLIARIRAAWSPSQQVHLALVHAAILGGHLRHGFRDLYKKDLTLMRDDNGPDYPCLLSSLLTLIRGYGRMHDQDIQGDMREKVVEAILNGLTPDPRAFIGKLPAPLASYSADQSEFSATFFKYRDDLFREFETHRPSDESYSPIAFAFNFPHNLVKGMVIDALFNAKPSTVSLNALLTGIPRASDGREAMARALMGYARRVPDNIGGRPVPVISYDPHAGLMSYAKTISILRDLTS
jgi:hypothetical protein